MHHSRDQYTPRGANARAKRLGPVGPTMSSPDRLKKLLNLLKPHQITDEQIALKLEFLTLCEEDDVMERLQPAEEKVRAVKTLAWLKEEIPRLTMATEISPNFTSRAT